MSENLTQNTKNPEKIYDGFPEERSFKEDELRNLRDLINRPNSGIITTAFVLGVVDDISSSMIENNRQYLLELACKNPRVFSIVCEADSLRNHLANGGKLFE